MTMMTAGRRLDGSQSAVVVVIGGRHWWTAAIRPGEQLSMVQRPNVQVFLTVPSLPAVMTAPLAFNCDHRIAIGKSTPSRGAGRFR